MKALIAGPTDIFICDNCVGLCADMIDQHNMDVSGPLVRARSRIEIVLSSPTKEPMPFVTSARLVEAWLALSDSSAASCRIAVAFALGCTNPHAALAALARIPVKDREHGDTLNEVAFYIQCGAYERGLERLETLSLDRLSPAEQLLFRTHRALCRLKSGLTRQADAGGVLDEMARAEEALGALDEKVAWPALRAAILRAIRAARAGCALVSGDWLTAERIAREAIASNTEDAEAYALLARVLSEKGDLAGAEEGRKAALRLAHPEGHLARSLQVTPAGPYR